MQKSKTMVQKGEPDGTNTTYEEEEIKLIEVMGNMNKSMKKVFLKELFLEMLKMLIDQ